jgi:hypothetical protein
VLRHHLYSIFEEIIRSAFKSDYAIRENVFNKYKSSWIIFGFLWVDVIEDHRVFGRYGCSPWNVFCCDFCQKEWRVPAIAVGEGGSVSRKEYERIEQAGSSNGG